MGLSLRVVAVFSAETRTSLVSRKFHPSLRALLLSALAILSVVSVAAETFRNPRHIPTGQDPVSLAVGDLNGDGHLDIVYGTTPYVQLGNNQVGVLHSLVAQPDGTYTDAADIDLPSGVSPACRLADLNGDGKLDLLCATFGYPGNAVAFAPGNGDGTFGSFVQSSLPAEVYTQYIAATGDINNDGRTDAILTDGQNNRIFVLLGDGSGHFSISLLTSSVTGPGEAVLRDLNGDGNLDLLLVGTLSNDVSVFLGNGNGSFQNPARYVGMQSIVLADADGDGRPDLISGGDGQLTILHGNANGTFNTTPIVNINYSTGTNIKTGYAEYLHAFAFQDLNGDGIPDILCGADDGLTTIMGKPGLQFAAPVPYPAGQSFYFSGDYLGGHLYATADMDNDGHLDFVGGGPNGIWISYGRANGTFDTGSVFESGSVVGYATVADFNHDGIPDVVTSGDTQLRLSLGKGDGTSRAATILPSTGVDFSTPLSPMNAYLFHGDFNGDGKQDILAVGSPSIYQYNFYRFNGHGDGTFDPPVQVSVGSPSSQDWETFAVADINNDGRDDLAISYGSTLIVNLAQSSGNFVPVSTPLITDPVYRIPSAPAFGDLDKDGKLDVAYTTAENVYVLFGHGDGTFTQGAALPIPKVIGSYAQFGGPAAIGDFDGDGHPDIAVLIPWARNADDDNEYPTQIFTFYGDGKGNFSNAVPGPSFLRPYDQLISADVDQDGRADLIFNNGDDLYPPDGPAIGIVHGSADRTLGQEINYVAGSGLSSLFVTDLNGDHFPDILAANGDYNVTANSFTVLLNLGNTPAVTGTLTAQPEPSQLGQTFQVTASLTPPPGTHTQLTGTISFTMDGTVLASATLSNNSATIPVSSKPAVGTHALNATWLGDANYGPVTLAGSHVVVGLASTTSLSASPNPAYALQSVTLTATVTAVGAPTGTVRFLDDGTTMGTAPLNANGSAALTVNFKTAGNHAVTAVYSGDATFNTSTSSSLIENVLINPSGITLSGPTTPVLAFQSTGLLATVHSADIAKYALAGSPSGSTTFFDGTTSLGSGVLSNGTASLNTTLLAAGAHSLTVVYSGDGAFSVSTSQPFTLLVLPDKTTTSLNVSPNPASVGTNVTFQAIVAVSGIQPTGMVTFYDDNTALGQATLDTKGSATFSTSTLSVGQHLISASYTGNVNFAPSTSSAVEVTITPFVGDFVIDVDPSSASIYTAESTTFRVTTAGTAGFNQNLALSCSGLAAESTCTFNPDSINGGTGKAKLTIQTTAPHPVSTAQNSWHFPWQGAVASMAILLLPRRIRRRGILLLVLATVATGALLGCGSPGPVTGGTPPGIYNIQVTATASQSGYTLTHSATIRLTVKSLF